MCGRYALYGPSSRLRDYFKVAADGFDFGPRYNLAPSQMLPVVSVSAGQRRLLQARWGLVPSWAIEPGLLPKPINAKAETAAEKAMFRHALSKSRILVPADAFYEWQQFEGKKVPFLVRMKNGMPFGMGGLLERWPGPSGELVTFTILTTEPNELMAAIHNRMPVIIHPDDYDRWLDPEVIDIARVQDVMKPYPAALMEAYTVGRMVNNPANDGPELIKAIEA